MPTADETNQFLKDLAEDMKDPDFAQQYEDAVEAVRKLQQEARDTEAAKDPALRYEATANLEDVESWETELNALALELTERADRTDHPGRREKLYRQAWLLRGAIEQAWRYEDLD